MTIQWDDATRNAMLDAIETSIGTSPKLRYYTGDVPANCAASATGTLIVEMTLPSDWAAAASGGSKAKSGTWSGTATGTGTLVAGYYRMLTSGGTVKEQGTITQAVVLTTSASTAANSNTLTFTATTGVQVGQAVAGTGIPTGATVLALSSTTVTISLASTAGVSSSAAITFGDTTGDLTVNNTSITNGQTVTVDTFTKTAPGA